MTYWVVMFDRDGGESEPQGPFESQEDAKQCALYVMDHWRWVSHEIQQGDD